MARYRQSNVAPGESILLSVNLSEQLLPGTFEHMINEIIGTIINISIFDQKYKNDKTGASAVPPVVLLKLIIYSYFNGINSSRRICKLSQENIIAKALTTDMSIHWTTIANFISTNFEEIKDIFAKVLMFCNELGLIGGEDFASDGLRLPSNASIENSGTKEQLEKRLEICRKMAEKHLERHLRKDKEGEIDEQKQEKFEKRQEVLRQRIEKINSFLSGMEDKIGKGGQALQSNVTDNESAVIKSPKGFIQGYVGLAVSDKKNQIIVTAEAHGSSNEGEHLPGLLDSVVENMEAIGRPLDKENPPRILCDANFSSEDNLKACEERGFEAIIPDCQEKRRLDESGVRKFDINDFKYDQTEKQFECPQGKPLEHKGSANFRGKEHDIYQASAKDCKACPDFSRCTWSKKKQDEINQGRKLIIQKGNEPSSEGSLCSKMRQKLSTEEYQEKYAYRIQIVEPVFANIGHCKGLDRFTLRGKKKVNGQWQLYCMMHNLEKCAKKY